MTLTRTAKWLSLASVSILAACTSSRRIDGSSAATFERSVAMLQNDLPARHRDDFDVALAVIWTRAAGASADVDGDGDVDYFDARVTADEAGDLLAAIARGDLVSAAEATKGEAVAAAYFRRLDDLGYDEVVALAGEPDVGRYLAQMKRQRSQAICAQRERPPEVRGFDGRISSRCDR